jgi:hypothetical protein
MVDAVTPEADYVQLPLMWVGRPTDPVSGNITRFDPSACLAAATTYAPFFQLIDAIAAQDSLPTDESIAMDADTRASDADGRTRAARASSTDAGDNSGGCTLNSGTTSFCQFVDSNLGACTVCPAGKYQPSLKNDKGSESCTSVRCAAVTADIPPWDVFEAEHQCPGPNADVSVVKATTMVVEYIQRVLSGKGYTINIGEGDATFALKLGFWSRVSLAWKPAAGSALVDWAKLVPEVELSFNPVEGVKASKALLIGKDLMDPTVNDFTFNLASYGARFQTEFFTRGCHWIPRMFASSEHACDQWHSSRESTALTGWHCKFCPNTEGTALGRSNVAKGRQPTLSSSGRFRARSAG